MIEIGNHADFLGYSLLVLGAVCVVCGLLRLLIDGD